MVQSATARINKYSAKISGDVAKIRTNAQKSFMIKKNAESAKALHDIEVRVKQIMENLTPTTPDGIPLLHAPYYIIFGKEIWKLSKKHKDQSLMDEVNTKVRKWDARGLNENVLRRIAEDIGKILY